jgi:hypothetical protein
MGNIKTKILCWLFGHKELFVRKLFGNWVLFRCTKCEELTAEHTAFGTRQKYDEEVARTEKLWKGEVHEYEFESFCFLD